MHTHATARGPDIYIRGREKDVIVSAQHEIARMARGGRDAEVRPYDEINVIAHRDGKEGRGDVVGWVDGEPVQVRARWCPCIEPPDRIGARVEQ